MADYIVPIEAPTDPDEARIAYILGQAVRAGPARGVGFTATELAYLETLISTLSTADLAVLDTLAGGTTAAKWNSLGIRPRYPNLLINSNFKINQFSWDTPVVLTNTSSFFCDGWHCATSGVAAFHSRQVDTVSHFSTDPSSKTGYATWTTADASLAAGDYSLWWQNIEAQRITSLSWGNSLAKSLLIRFEALVQVAGTYSLKVSNNAGTRSYVIPWVVTPAQASVWTLFEFTVPGDTTGTWDLTSAGGGLVFGIGFAMGSTYHAAAANTWSNGSFWGVAGQTNASALIYPNTSFYFCNFGLYVDVLGLGIFPNYEEPDPATELALCQRYYQKSYDERIIPGTISNNGEVLVSGHTANSYVAFQWMTMMRTTPTITLYSPNTGLSGRTYNYNATVDVVTTIGRNGASGGAINSNNAGTTIGWQWVADARI